MRNDHDVVDNSDSDTDTDLGDGDGITSGISRITHLLVAADKRLTAIEVHLPPGPPTTPQVDAIHEMVSAANDLLVHAHALLGRRPPTG